VLHSSMRGALFPEESHEGDQTYPASIKNTAVFDERSIEGPKNNS